MILFKCSLLIITSSNEFQVKVKLMVMVKVKSSLCLIKHHAMKTYRGVEV
jgi:hypothetical protein